MTDVLPVPATRARIQMLGGGPDVIEYLDEELLMSDVRSWLLRNDLTRVLVNVGLGQIAHTPDLRVEGPMTVRYTRLDNGDLFTELREAPWRCDLCDRWVVSAVEDHYQYECTA